MSEEENEDYIVCYKCGKLIPKNYKFCPFCGRRIIRIHTTPLLLISAGVYFLNAILLGIIFSPHLLFVVTLELITAFFLIFGIKFAAGLGLMLSVLNIIYLIIYVLTQHKNPIAITMLIITHLTGAYLIIHEWENLT